jgi:hypothetical protein
MGWDCTLHVVDDVSLAKFSARFMHGLHRDGAFDEQYDGDDLIAKVKDLIAHDIETGARALGELALLFVSTETPHAYCRGFALSLWDDEVMGAALPAKLLGSVESRLPNILAAYPKLAGRIPKVFDQNFCVGPMVAARDVPALLAHVHKVLDAMVPGDRRRYKPLVDVLAVAAERNLGYWEGTDIDVAQAHEDWLAPVRPAMVQLAENPLTSPLARPLALDGTRMLVGEHFVLHEVDIATFPPEVRTHDDMQVMAAAFTPWDTTFVRMATDRSVRPFKFGYYELSAGELGPTREQLDIEPALPIGLARRAGDSLLLFPQPTSTEQRGVPLVLRRTGLAPLALPEAVPDFLQAEAYPFGDGSLLVLWDAIPYRWDGNGEPMPLGGEPIEAPDGLFGAVTLSDGSIVGGFGRKLVRFDREGKRTIVLPLDNVMSVARGPDDVLIIAEGDNPEADAFKLWWPETREVTHVPPATLGLDDDPTFSYFDAKASLLVAARPGKWHAIPWSELEAMRRVSEDAFVARRAELVAQSADRAQ